MKRKLFSGFMILLAVLMYGCEKDSCVAEITYPIKYSFYNDGDAKFQKVVVYCTTFIQRKRNQLAKCWKMARSL
ncbi:MAG: hypothetical protein HC831_28440 [Chloroflexia bacterium]|nr:hypothetical protein [Chloroflexia bacterium]